MGFARTVATAVAVRPTAFSYRIKRQPHGVMAVLVIWPSDFEGVAVRHDK